MRLVPVPLAVLGVVLGVVLGAACGPARPSAAPPAATASASVPAAATPADPVPAATSAGTGSWVMPDLVGVTLQDAQDAVQALTDFAVPITTSTDATGAGRMQVVDGNWRVCVQNVAAGSEITASSRIDFEVVKLDESC